MATKRQAPWRIAYKRRNDGVIQRYKTRIPRGKLADEVPKALWVRQVNNTARIQKDKRRAHREVAKAKVAPPVRETAQRSRGVGKVPKHLIAYRTFFKAAGTSQPALSPPEDPFGIYPEQNSPPPPGMVTGPNYFYSNAAITGGLGQVQWEGIVPLEKLIDELNQSLAITDQSGRERDFRSVYKRWSYRYIVMERLRTGGGERIIADVAKTGRA